MGIFGSSIAEGAQRRPDAGSTRPSSGIPGSTDLLTLNLAKSGDLAKSGGPTGILGGVSVGKLIGGSLAGFGVGSLLVQPGYDPTTGYFLFDPPSMPAILDRPARGDAMSALKLLQELLGDRGKYVAVLTIARTYAVHGMPERLPETPSYAAWSNLVRSPLVWLGMTDPIDTVAHLRSSDPIRGVLGLGKGIKD